MGCPGPMRQRLRWTRRSDDANHVHIDDPEKAGRWTLPRRHRLAVLVGRLMLLGLAVVFVVGLLALLGDLT